MLFMNEYDIDLARAWFAGHPVLEPATRFLSSFRDEVDSHSDGWAYWKAPVQSAAKLMTLIKRSEQEKRNREVITATREEYRKTLVPIKAFYTRRGNAAGMQWPIGDRRDEA